MLDDMMVFHKAYELVKWMHGLLNNFPKSEKYTLAQRIENTELSILEGIIQSNNDFDKRAAIEKTIVELDKLRIFFRLAKDLQFIPFSQYEEGVKRLDEIGRLLGGWRKKSLPMRQQAGGAGRIAPTSLPGADAGAGKAGCPAVPAEAAIPPNAPPGCDASKEGNGIHGPSKAWTGRSPMRGRAVNRGGNWDNGANAGPFNANFNNAPTDTNNNIGFRCCNSSEKAGRGQSPPDAGFGTPTGGPDSARELQGLLPKHAIHLEGWNGGMLNIKRRAARLVAGCPPAGKETCRDGASESNAAAAQMQTSGEAAFGQASPEKPMVVA